MKKALLFGFFATSVFAFVLMSVPQALATGSPTINSATLNGSASVNVSAGGTITAIVNASTHDASNGSDWKSVGWRISTTTGAFTCVDTVNVHNNSTSTSFNIVAPASGGTYNVYFRAYAGSDSCDGEHHSNTFKMTDGVVVSKSQTITFNSLPDKTYGDSDFGVSATSDSGLAVSFTSQTPSTCTLSGSTVHLVAVAAGTCTIRAFQAGNVTYSAALNVERSLVISPRTLTVSATGVNKVYDGGVVATVTLSDDRVSGDVLVVTDASAEFATSTVGTGIAISVSGISISGVDAGNYTLANTTAATVADITKDPGVIVLNKTNLTRTYDGTPQAVSVISTTPEGLPYAVTYNGFGTVPTNAGPYTVLAVLTDPNYSGTDSADLVINKANQTITFGPLGGKTFGDPDFSVSATASSELPVTFTTGEGACSITEGNTVHLTGAGTCTIIAHQGGGDNYNPTSDVTQSFAVGEQPPTDDSGARAPMGGPMIIYGEILPPANGTTTPPGQVLGTSTQGEATTTPAGQVLGASTSCGLYINSYMARGAKNDPADVKNLQQFLNDMFKLNIPSTGIFGLKTEAGVKQFQLAYSDTVLKPWVAFGHPDAQTPTGVVYKLTKWQINMLKCPDLGLPAPELP